MDRIRELIDQIKELNYHYYTLDQPLISDGEYDLLYDELLRLEKETGIVYDDSPTNVVGDKILDKFEKHTHLGRLYSLGKAQSYGEIEDWIFRTEKLRQVYNDENPHNMLPELEYVIELKFDGLTINLTYENRNLTYATTRGTGQVGEEISAQVATIKTIPKKIAYKGLVEISGEGVMPLSQLKKYNEVNEIKLKNARNAAAGALRNLDLSVTRSRHLEAYLYNIGYMEPQILSSQTEIFDFLRENNFQLYPFMRIAKSFEEIKAAIEEISEFRKTIDVLTDGVVIKINDFRTREVLGFTNKFPRWALAYKFEAEQFTTIVREVVWNVGRTGKVTPVAILDPVDIDGVTVTRATLNNYDDIKRKNVAIGSRVIIRRSNDVIPEILMAVDDENPTEKIEKPEKCPACGTELFYDKVHIFCPNSMDCKPQMQARIVHYCSREAMNIEGISEKTVERFTEELDITRVDQLYDLRKENLINLEGFKDKKADKLISAIENSKHAKLDAFIYALGIPNVGVKTAGDLALRFRSLSALRSAGYEDLIEISDIGDITAKAIVEFFASSHIKLALERLIDKGIELEEADEEISSDLKDLTIVVTGTIEGYNRKEIEKELKLRGAKVASAVSKNTDILLAGENAGSKLEKAKGFGTKIYQDQELKSFLDSII